MFDMKKRLKTVAFYSLYLPFLQTDFIPKNIPKEVKDNKYG